LSLRLDAPELGGCETIHSVSPPAATFLAACRRQHVDDQVPVWFMRQAGRSLPEYRAIRAGVPMLHSCTQPDLVTEITLQPVRRYGVDAAIFYSDIMVPLKAVGVDLDIVAGTGPVIAHPVRSLDDLKQLRPLEPTDVEYVTEAVHHLVAELGERPLIGFAGAPFTLASYLVEGGPSKDYAKTKSLMVSEPQLWDGLCTRLADISAAFLIAQVRAGASAVQLFDSWAGSLSAADYVRYVQPYSARVLAAVGSLGVPRIHFGVGTSELLVAMGAAGAEVVGVDWRLPLAEASRRIGPEYAVQGNLDSALLTAPWPVLADRVRDVLRSGALAPGHIFNLGHGVPPTTDPDVLSRIVDLVHSEGPALRAEARAELAGAEARAQWKEAVTGAEADLRGAARLAAEVG
jgi:uroporphyrinogen decarboxylase